MRPLRRIAVSVAGLVLLAGIASGAWALWPRTLVPGGSGACQSAAHDLIAFANHYETWLTTPGEARRTFWALHAHVLADCPLTGVAWLSTHQLAPYLGRSTTTTGPRQ